MGYRYGYLELKRKAGKSEREAKQEDNFLVGTPYRAEARQS